MNPQQVQQAYQILASMEQTLQTLTEQYRAVAQLLSVQQANAQTPAALQQTAAPATTVAQPGTTVVDISLWDRGQNSQGKGQVGGIMKLNDAEQQLMLWQSDPNQNGLVFNGYILPKDSDRNVAFQDKKLGGVFMYKTQQGLTLNVAFDESPMVANPKFTVPLMGNAQKTPGDRRPDIVGQVSLPYEVFYSPSAVAGLPGTVPQQGQPADPSFNVNAYAQPNQQYGLQAPAAQPSVLGSLLS